MKLSTRSQARGLFRIIRGTTRVTAGRICSNRTLGVKGRFECLAGRLQMKVGKVQGLCGL
jgi:uncharacterized protein YjbJ (UPF0337 family)